MNTTAPTERLVSDRAEILGLINQAPRVMLCLRIRDCNGNGDGHLWPSKKQARALINGGELDGYAGQLIDENLLILNRDFSWERRDEHKTERFRALATEANRKGRPVPASVADWLRDHPAAVVAATETSAAA